MDVRTQQSTFVLPTDLSVVFTSGICVLLNQNVSSPAGLSSLPVVLPGWVTGSKRSPQRGRGSLPLALVEVAAWASRAGDLCPEHWRGHRRREGHAVVLGLCKAVCSTPRSVQGKTKTVFIGTKTGGGTEAPRWCISLKTQSG